MNIAVDLDDTINDFSGHFMNFLKREKNILIQKAIFCSPNMANSMGITREKLIALFDEFHSEQNIKFMPLQPHVKEMLSSISKKHDLFVVTGRLQHHTWELEEWFTKHFPRIFQKRYIAKNPYVISNDHLKTKHEICKDLKIDLVIDDDPHFALPIAEHGFQVLMIHHPWNAHIKHDLITHVQDWKEIHQHIQNHHTQNGIKTSTAKK